MPEKSFHHDQLKLALGDDVPEGFFSPREFVRTLRKHRYGVPAAATALKKKYEWLASLGLADLAAPSSSRGGVGISGAQIKARGAGDRGLYVSALRREITKGYIQLLPEEAGDRDERPIILFTRRFFFPLVSEVEGADLGAKSSNYQSAIRCVAYTLQKAVHELDELDEDVDGFVVVLDFAGSGAANFSESIDRQIASACRTYFPETLHAMYIANGGLILKGLGVLAKAALPAKTKSKIITLPASPQNALSLLRKDISKSCIPRQLGGTFDVPAPEDYLKTLAADDGVDLELLKRRLSDQADRLISKENLQLKGLQYSNLGAQKCMEIAGVRHKGVLLWKKKEGGGGGALSFVLGKGNAWKRLIGILRDDVMLLFESTTSASPTLVVSLDGVQVRNADVESRPRGTFCFFVKNEGAMAYCFATSSEKDRMQWVHLIESGKLATSDIKMNIQFEEDEFARMNTDLLGLDGVDEFEAARSPKGPHKPSENLVNQLASLGLGGLNSNSQATMQNMRSNPQHSQPRMQNVRSSAQQPPRVPMGQGNTGAAIKLFPAGVRNVQEYGNMWKAGNGEQKGECNVVPGNSVRGAGKVLQKLGFQIVQVLDDTQEAICAARSASNGHITLLHLRINDAVATATCRAQTPQLMKETVQLVTNTLRTRRGSSQSSSNSVLSNFF